MEYLYKQGLQPAKIFQLLKAEGLLVVFTSAVPIIKKLKTTTSVPNLLRSGRPTKMSEAAKA